MSFNELSREPQNEVSRSSTQSIGRYWILTIPHGVWTPPADVSTLDRNAHIVALKGQGEEGEGGFRHWQLVVRCDRSVRFSAIKKAFPKEAHIELCRSAAANDYVHKDDTAIIGTRFTIGEMAVGRGPKREPCDWENIYKLAKGGSFDEIPPAIYIRHKASLNAIYVDNIVVADRDVKVVCYYGDAGVGKSLRAKYETRNMSVFKKDPTSKWWDGYKGEEAVVVDEYYGEWPLSNFLIWCDRYGSRGEVKGGSCPLLFKTLIFTSNVAPHDWYKRITVHQQAAIKRRISSYHMDTTAWMDMHKQELQRIGYLPRPVEPESETDYGVLMSNLLDMIPSPEPSINVE